MAFGSDGMLYLAGGDGASFTVRDYGQRGGTVPNAADPYTPINPCGDPLTVTSPPGTTPVVDVRSQPRRGALRSQDVRTTGDPTGLAGSLIRIDPDTGAGRRRQPAGRRAPTPTPAGSSPTGSATRSGSRSGPATDELYIGDVGNIHWEEIERFVLRRRPGDADDAHQLRLAVLRGPAPTDGWQALGVDMCDDLYDDSPSAVTRRRCTPTTTPGPPRRAASSATLRRPRSRASRSTSADVADQTPFPARYDGALFFVDYSRDCLACCSCRGEAACPDPTTMEVVATGVGNPVDLVRGPARRPVLPGPRRRRWSIRIRYAAEPVAHATATPPCRARP